MMKLSPAEKEEEKHRYLGLIYQANDSFLILCVVDTYAMTKEFCRSIELLMHRRARQPTGHEVFFDLKYFTIVTNPNQQTC